ncbi:MAG: YraN family protein [Alphaproteobacteria bacterium]|nr:YraN family protein [Alphaproteobacteria bacterium]
MPLFSLLKDAVVQQKDKSQTSYAKGVEAEDIAADFLAEHGYEILERRYKTKYGEIDIIALQENGEQGVLCFVEVKVRNAYEEAVSAVTPRTQQRIENSALSFLAQEPAYVAYDMRFDVVAITRGCKIWHLDNAWQART